MPKPEVVYLDACVWLELERPNATDDPALGSVLRQMDEGALFPVASYLLLQELLTVPAAWFESRMDGKKGLLHPVDRTVVHKARTLQDAVHRAHRRNLGHVDATHLATASVLDARRFVTLDQRRKGGGESPLNAAATILKAIDVRVVRPEDLAVQVQKVFTLEDPGPP